MTNDEHSHKLVHLNRYKIETNLYKIAHWKLNHFFIHLIDVLLETILNYFPLQFKSSRDQPRFWSPSFWNQSHHFWDFKLLQVGFNSVDINTL